FTMLHESSGARIRNKRVDEKSGREVPWDEIVKGYELTEGNYVTFTHDELEELDVESMRTIDIDTFVELADIDPIYYDTTYYIAPQEGGEKAYHLMARALGEGEKVGIAKFAMRQKEHLCALRESDGMLVLETMHWPAEIRDRSDLDGLDSKPQTKEREVEMAMNLVDQLTGKFEPDRYRNTFEQHVKAAAEKKVKGEEISTLPEVEETEPVGDLMELLRASLESAKSGKKPKAAAAAKKSTTKSSSKSSSKSSTKAHSRSWFLDHSKDELLEIAQHEGLAGRSKMTKDELADALAK
ncbi:MAG: Ku protein, partial [Thermoleophilia bacterium]|nr:Ku protein [Thermoleophilia bacterium]